MFNLSFLDIYSGCVAQPSCTPFATVAVAAWQIVHVGRRDGLSESGRLEFFIIVDEIVGDNQI